MMSVEKSIYYHFVIFCLIIKTGSWSDSGSKRLFGVDAVFLFFAYSNKIWNWSVLREKKYINSIQG